jgi:hypothetical protein
MVPCSIPNQHCLDIGLQCPGELGQEQIHDSPIKPWCDQSLCLAGFGARRSQHIDKAVLCLSDSPWTRSCASPDACQRPLLSEPRFVFVEDFEPPIGILRLDGLELLAKLFLNSSCVAGSDSGCFGLGTSDE